ncbi:hypothetical protein J2W56_001444 [Nocardia kruczakiae]|uniref:Uncharacterized protein n=1 Tax=Nocardia kruczakiae TaxID=261477 RepID=A0ABU1XB06_9NOCA|nr:hypothetical protein [Nocardia kruczakiae]MDR7167725.1 hypothetical protein [Nocardia kruczakiae]
MQLGSSRKSGRLRNRLIAAGVAAAAGGAAWAAASRRPQLPEPAAEPPRLGYAGGATAPRTAAQPADDAAHTG